MAAAEAFCAPAPSKQHLALYGGEASDYMPDIEVNPAIIDSYNIFADMETQWVISPAGSFVGFNYASIGVVMDIHGVTDKKAIFNDLRVMEVAARTVLNNRSAENG